MKYELDQKKKLTYEATVLINQMINYQQYFPVKLTGDDIFLEEPIKHMLEKGMIEIQSTLLKKAQYIPTAKGREYLKNFMEKYYEYLKMFDIFCAVDLAKGEFAFAKMFSDMSDEEYNNHLNDPRFSDVRVAVAEFKGLDPTEIVFMSYLNEGKFEVSEPKWQYKLTGDDIWNEINNVCNIALKLDYLKENDVIQDVIKKGAGLMIDLLKQEQERDAELAGQDEVVEETITEEVEEYVDVVDMPYYAYDYWDPYYDPYYISPIWLAPVLFF